MSYTDLTSIGINPTEFELSLLPNRPQNESKKLRIIYQNGRSNIFLSHIPQKYVAFINDWGNTLLNIRWRWILVTMCLTNFIGYYLFGLFWMLLAYLSGDFEKNRLETEMCVMNTHTLTGYILLSIETITTIGNGYIYPTEQCEQGWIILVLQSFVSIAMQGAFVTVVYVKLAKPFTKTNDLFSQKAVICLRDGKLCFMIRLFDSTGKVSVGTKISMYFVDKDEIEANRPIYIKQMMVEPYGLLLFPMEIVHVIDSTSPLWKLTPNQLENKNLEIIVVVEGGSRVTAQLAQHRTSYITKDILWGHRFEPCFSFSEEKQKFIISRKKIHATMPQNASLTTEENLKSNKCE